MASSLTSTNLKSGFLYLLLIVVASCAVLYLLLPNHSKTINHLQKKSLVINSSALKNGIKFANMKFKLKKNNSQRLNLWISNGVGLDFNDNGFPIGSNISNLNQQLPKSSKQCRQIWKFVLGPLQPKLELKFNNGYWTKLEKNNTCSYRYSSHKPYIVYHSLSGTVTLSD